MFAKDPHIKSWSDQITLRTQRGVSNLRVLDPANPGFAGRIEKQRREAIPQLGMQEQNMAKGKIAVRMIVMTLTMLMALQSS